MSHPRSRPYPSLRLTLTGYGRLIAALVTAVVSLAAAAPALAEHRPSPPTRRAIVRALHRYSPAIRVLSTRVSSRGPYALAHTQLRGLDQRGWILLSRHDWRWRVVSVISVISDQGMRCDQAPRSVIHDLHLLRYADGHTCSGSFR